MSSVREYRVSRTSRSAGRPARRGLVLLAAAAVLVGVSACGSGSTSSSGQTSGSSAGSSDAASTTAVAVAGAQENAVTTEEGCRDWPRGSTAVPCAVGTMGPAGGRVFYDSVASLGSVQPWGRFLEVAPMGWNDYTGDCKWIVQTSACGREQDQSGDQGTLIIHNSGERLTSGIIGFGYPFCAADSAAMHSDRSLPRTGAGLGDGRANTKLLLGEAACTTGIVDAATYAKECVMYWGSVLSRCITSQSSVLTAVASFRGGGHDDWYLPSQDELMALCRYNDRNGIGGFWSYEYASSTVLSGGTDVQRVEMGNCKFTDQRISKSAVDYGWVECYCGHLGMLVRPIRAFVGPAVVTEAVCHDWPAGTTVLSCAVGAMGPGGGRVFYDAGSKQAWGRYLEVAPQAWGGTLYDCSSCGAASGVSTKTSDNGGNTKGYNPCRAGDSTARLLPGEAADTLWEIGGGRHNTEVLSKTPECVDGSVSAVSLAAGYRGGGLSDWYLPSGGELTELCKYTGRNAIGGFSGDAYASSTVGPKDGSTNFHQVQFYGNPLCVRRDGLSSGTWSPAYVRPIRAFS